MQGGSIGVSSTQNEGSTFSFYIKSRRASPPHPTSPNQPPTSGLPTRSKAETIKSHNADQAVPLVPLAETEKKKEEEGIYHILIVEDNLINQRVLSTQLKKLGHVVHVANHGLEALDLLSKTTYSPCPSPNKASPDIPATSPDTTNPTTTRETPPNKPSQQLPLSVILMDVEMPIMDGLTCTRRIRSMESSGQLLGHVPIIAVSANARREQVEQARKAGVDDAICKPFRIPELMALVRGLGVRGVR
jgi:CheY-like chemotaxis protein